RSGAVFASRLRLALEAVVKAKDIGVGKQRRFVMVLESGDEVVGSLTQFAKDQRITDASFTAIGAFSHAVLGYFDWKTKAYRRIPVEEQVEVVSLMGDIALDERDEPSVHAHAVLGTADGAALGGHLLEGKVRPTLEIVLSPSPV